MSRRLLIPPVLGTSLLLLWTAPLNGQEVELTRLTEQQAWERAALNLSGFMAAMIVYGQEQGHTPLEVGRRAGRILGETWDVPDDVDPAAYFADGMAINFQSWAGADPTLMPAETGTTAVGFNATYSEWFAPDVMLLGVSLDEFDAYFQGVVEGIAAHLGLQATMTRQGDRVVLRVHAAEDR